VGPPKNRLGVLCAQCKGGNRYRKSRCMNFGVSFFHEGGKIRCTNLRYQFFPASSLVFDPTGRRHLTPPPSAA
jgi:hypothetical protein